MFSGHYPFGQRPPASALKSRQPRSPGGRWLAAVATALLGLTLHGQAPNPSFDFAAGASVACSPAVGTDGTLYFATRAGDVFAVLPSGAERWRIRLPRGVIAPVTLGGDDTVYVGVLDGTLRAFSSAGVARWSFRTDNEIWGGVAVGADGSIFFGSRDGKVSALTRDGQVRWQHTLGGGITETPALGADGTLYIGGRNDRFVALAPDGTLKWSLAIAQPSTPAIGPDGTIYVGSSDNRLRALTPAGAVRWSYDTSASVRSSPTVAPDGRVYVASWNGEVRCLRPDGTLVWYAKLGEDARYSSASLGADGHAYVVTVSGLLFSLNGTTGAIRWSTAEQGRVDAASPVMAASGVVYFATDTGRVLGFPLSGGSAPGSWPMAGRDARRSGGGFVARDLPVAFGAGAGFDVTLVAEVPGGTGFYTVEDTPPASWSVTAVGDGGVFDANQRRVKFGPFRDGASRRLTYRVEPPLGEAGLRTFAGTSVSDGGERWVMGDQVLESIPLHPADLVTVDGWLTLREMTAYAGAWRRGTAWAIPPANIPATYLDRAIELWLAGEAYRYDTNFATAPGWWLPVLDGQPLYPPPAPVMSVAPNGSIVSRLPATVIAGTSLDIELTVTPATNVLVYAVEEIPPAGWTIGSITDAGVFDARRARLKWGPFFDAAPRTLRYRVEVPAAAAGVVEFAGAAGFDSALGTTAGARRLFVGTPDDAGIFVTRELPGQYSPAASLTVRLHSAPPRDSFYHLFEDSPPAGWVVTQISDGGWFDAAARKVRFGPFLDSLPRTVTYDVTPPAGERGVRQFIGVSTLNGLTAVIVGDSELDSMLLHPADTPLADSWLTLGEVTAYGAAWKRGNAWPTAPTPIPNDYLARAILLWRGGEAYTVDTANTNAPDWWIGSTNAFTDADVPPPITPGATSTNSFATREAPRFFTNGVPVPIVLTVTPAETTLVNAIEEELPVGWALVSASDGVTNVTRGKLRWGPFFDARPRTLTYQIVAHAITNDFAVLDGHAAFDGLGLRTTGADRMIRSDAPLAPEFTEYQLTPAGGIELTLKGLAGEVYLLSASTNLISWQPLATLTNLAGTMNYVDPAATNHPGRFYRALWP